MNLSFQCLAILSLVLSFSSVNADLDYSRVHLVEYNKDTNNFLFRGNMPANSSMFEYDRLMGMLSDRAVEANLTWPKNPYLVDISFNNPFDGEAFLRETEFWKQNSSSALGEFVWWPLVGSVLSPSELSKEEQTEYINNGTCWDVDMIPKRIEKVNGWMKQSNDVPHVHYVHCTAGCDRTGEFVGSYRTMYQMLQVPLTPANMTGVYALDVSECGRPPNYYSTSALEWYCLTFEQTTGKDAGECLKFATCKFLGDCTPI